MPTLVITPSIDLWQRVIPCDSQERSFPCNVNPSSITRSFPRNPAAIQTRTKHVHKDTGSRLIADLKTQNNRYQYT